ncbi:MAG: septum formation inhibitor Maf [Gemmatimonadaceae bacterium]|nr:septum formation inhibitor Maf [Gemmatimonadaceae bacterium]
MKKRKVVLASSSPRRRDLLDLIGIKHDVRPADIDESMRAGERASDYAERLAREKAEAIGDDSSDIVIGADTVVVIDGRVLGKPVNEQQASAMLESLGGRTHTVVTAIAIVADGRTSSGVEQVTVTFRALTADEISSYVATGEPMDKAGAYGIQGFGATLVERIEGDYFAVMGLPLVRLVRLLAERGIHYDFGKGVQT